MVGHKPYKIKIQKWSFKIDWRFDEMRRLSHFLEYGFGIFKACKHSFLRHYFETGCSFATLGKCSSSRNYHKRSSAKWCFLLKISKAPTLNFV